MRFWLRSRYPDLADQYQRDLRRRGLREWLRDYAPDVLAEYDAVVMGNGRT